MHTETRALAAICFILLIIASVFKSPGLNAQEELRKRLEEVYVKLVNAEKEGAKTEGAAEALNEALELIRRAEGTHDPEAKRKLLARAENLINDVEGQIPELVRKARERRFWNAFIAVISIALIAAMGWIAYAYGPKTLWLLWLRFRAEWRVRKRDR